MLFSSDAVDELIVAASTVVQPAVLAAAHYYAQKVQLDQRTPRVAVPRQRNSVVVGIDHGGRARSFIFCGENSWREGISHGYAIASMQKCRGRLCNSSWTK